MSDWPIFPCVVLSMISTVPEANIPDASNIANLPLVDRQNVILPPLHIKLGLIKQLVKALDKESAAFKYLVQKFPALSEAKVKEGIVVGPDIRQLLNDNNFELTMDNFRLAAWKAFRSICKDFLGNHCSPKYMDIFKNYYNHTKL